MVLIEKAGLFIVAWLLLQSPIGSQDIYCCPHGCMISSHVFVDCSASNLAELPEDINPIVEVLYLSDNIFENVPIGMGKLLNLEVLSLAGNSLNSVATSELSKLVRIRSLNISNNRLEHWEEYGISSTLEKLDLSRNKIEMISGDSFTRMEHLSFLDLSENNLERLDNTIFEHATNLQQLILSNNKFFSIPYFKSTSLRSLSLNNCQINSLQKDDFETKPNLIEIDLSQNEIESIPNNLSSQTLQYLDLSFNEIKSVNDLSFHMLPNLAVLSLRGNDFEDIWKTTYFASNQYLREIDLAAIRWNCKGFSIDLLLMYSYLTSPPAKVSDANLLMCYEPSNVSGLTWQAAYLRSYHISDSTSSDPTLITVYAVFAGVLLGISITACILKIISRISQNYSSTGRPDQVNEENLNRTLNTNTDSDEVVVRLRDNHDLPPTYAQALLMPKLDGSFRSLPDNAQQMSPHHAMDRRRSRSSGNLLDPESSRANRYSVRRYQEANI